jgi:hypothetical protein
LTPIKRRTLCFLLGGLLLALATPAYLALARPGLKTYLLQPLILAVQALPYLVAACLWLPWRSAAGATAGQALAGILLLVAVLLYVPMLTGLWATGGDMVGLAFLLIAATTTVGLVLATLIAFAILWWRHRGLHP